MPRLDANPPINITGLLFTRWLMSAALVFGAYNPSGTSYYHWATSSEFVTPGKLFVGILILGLAVAILRMAFLSIGYFGTATILFMLGMGVVFAVGLGLVDLDEFEFTTYTIEVWITLVLAIGTSWAFIQRRISGERDVLRSPP